MLFSSCLSLGSLYSICTFSLLVITFSSVACAVYAAALNLIVSAHCFWTVQRKYWPKYVDAAHDSSKSWTEIHSVFTFCGRKYKLKWYLCIFPIIRKRRKSLLDIFVETISKLQATGWAFPMAAFDWHFRDRRRPGTFCGVLLIGGHHYHIFHKHLYKKEPVVLFQQAQTVLCSLALTI